MTPDRQLDAPPRAAIFWDRTVEILVVALIAWLPFAFGGVLPSSHLVLIAAAAAIAFCLALRTALVPERPFVWSWAYAPATAFVVLVGLQLVELSPGALEIIAPRTEDVWREGLARPPSADGALDALTISLYPHGTRTDLRLLLALLVIFVGVVNVYRHSPEVRRLLAAVAVIGLLCAALAIAQDAASASKIYWSWNAPGKIKAGPFVHYGHFSQFLNLAIGASLGLVLLRARQRTPERRLGLADLVRHLTWPERRLDLLLAIGIVMSIAAIALSTSRNGVVSMFVAGIVVAIVFERTRFLVGIGWPLIGMAFAAFVVLVLLGFDPLYERLSALDDPAAAYSTRLALLTDTLRAFTEFPVLGLGQGTFEWTFPMFDTDTRPVTAAHAENQYAELLVETGAVGFALVASVAIFVGAKWIRRVRNQRRPVHAAVFGLAFGLIAVGFHAFTDFGLRIPAVAMLATVCAGLIVGLGTHAEVQGKGQRLVATTLCTVAAVLLVSALPAAGRAWDADVAWDGVRSGEKDIGPPAFGGGADEYESLLEHARLATGLLPDDVEYRYWTEVYTFHRDLAGVRAVDDELLPVEAMRPIAERTRSALLDARRSCAIFGPLWSVVGQLGVRWLERPEDAEWIRRGRELAPHYASTALAYAVDLVRQGEDDAALVEFERAIRLGSPWRTVVFPKLIDELERPDLAMRLAAGDPARMYGLARRIAGSDRDWEGKDQLASAASDEALRLLIERCDVPGAPSWMYSACAQLLVERGDDEAAVGYYETFLSRQQTPGVRRDFIRVLERLGRHAEAARQRQLLESHR